MRELKASGLLPQTTRLRSSKFLDNLVEQDHRNVKLRVRTMLGFKAFRNAAVTTAGVELMHRIRKGQFNFSRLRLKDTSSPAVWNTVLAA